MGTEEINLSKEFAKDAQESQDVASIQRVASNEIQKSQLSVLKFIAGLVATAAIALIPIIVTDHFTLVDVNKTVALIAAKQLISSDKIDKLEKNMPTVHSRWSLGMQTDFTKQLSSQNKNILVPDVKEIQESHLGDL